MTPVPNVAAGAPSRANGSRPAARSRTPKPLRTGQDHRKLGEILAERIENEIVSSGWRVGEVLGSEAELIERYGVSRAVFREAMRIVDHHGVAEMRRGPGGGLVVSHADLAAVVRAVVLQLEYKRIRPDQVHEARSAIELECVRLASERITPQGGQRLRDFLTVEEERIRTTRQAGRPRGDLPSHDFHILLAELTGNPAMQLFVQMVTRVLGDLAPRAHSLAEVASEVHHAHARIAEAVIAGDAETARRRMARHLGSVMEYLGSREPAGRRAPKRNARGRR
ncbi:MAG TPA: FCD domain-containing protein [Candidatus Dormibacteraeota bacterium]